MARVFDGPPEFINLTVVTDVTFENGRWVKSSARLQPRISFEGATDFAALGLRRNL